MAQEAASSTTQDIIPTAADTLPVFYSLMLEPDVRYPTNDTLPDFDFRMYDPARKGAIDYGHLGNLGSAARPLWFNPLSRIGFETGMHAFDLYTLSPKDLRFYRHARTYSNVGFSRGRTQRDAASFVRISRTFAGGLNVSLQYQTINNLGEYRFQRTKHSSLVGGVWWPVRKNYNIYLVYASNTHRQEDNGGITDLNFFTSNLYNGAISVPVLFDADAKTKHRLNNLQLTQYFTIGKSKNVLKAEHILNYITESWKFSDPTSSAADFLTAATYYGELNTDVRGLRHYFEVQRLDNQFMVSTLRKSKKDKEAGSISAGIKHSLINVYREPLPDSIVNNLFLNGKFALTPSSKFSFVAAGDLGVLSNTGEYRLTGSMKLEFGKIGVLQGQLLSQLRPPDLIHARLISTARPVWSNNFKDVLENSITATYSIPSLLFEASAANHLVNNYLYFDQKGFPVQMSDKAVQISQLMIRQRFNIGILHTTHTLAYQQINSNNVVRLPNWFSKNTVAVQGLLFEKKLLINTGVDFRINSNFTPDSYQGFTGQFQLQDSVKQLPYPSLDYFVGIKIQAFRFYFRFENLASFWSTDNLYFTANHPQNQATFRLGISWRFLDGNIVDPNQQNNSGGGSGSGPPAGIRRN